MIVGIVGLGRMGLIHAKNLLEMGHTVSVYDPNMQQTELDVNSASDIEMLSISDAVVIATATKLHAEHIKACASKHMFVEKPIVETAEQALVLGAVWKNRIDYAMHTPITMVGNNMRYHPVVKVVKERMRELGGKYNSAWFSLSQKKEKPRDHVVLNWGAHEVDLAHYLLDNGLEFWQQEAKVSEDSAAFFIRRASGPPVHIHLDYNGDPSEHRYFTIHGNDASIHADIDNFVVHIFSRQGREIIAVEGSHEEAYRAEMTEFIRRVEGKEPDGIGATGEDGIRCLKVLLEAMNAST